MDRQKQQKLERRVVEAAEAALADRQFVSAIDVLQGMGWLAPSAVDRWRQGRVDSLERLVTASLPKITKAMAAFRRWARDRGLNPSETVYVARTRDRRRSRFSVSGEEGIEQAYRTHWVSPALSEAEREKLASKQSEPDDLVVIWAVKDWSCTECAGSGELLYMEGDGPLCLSCADLDHLEYLPRGDAAITRRAKKASTLAAVVVRFSRARKRYERQGILVEAEALANAEEACLADEEVRARRRERDRERRTAEDVELLAAFAQKIREQFPGCPPERADMIAAHAALRCSGRVGRSAAGRALVPEAVALAVTAAVRHGDTSYDEQLARGVPRLDARADVRADVDEVLAAWRRPLKIADAGSTADISAQGREIH